MHDVITIRTRPHRTVWLDKIIAYQTFESTSINFTTQFFTLRTIRRIDFNTIRFTISIWSSIISFAIFRFILFVPFVCRLVICFDTIFYVTVRSTIAIAWFLIQMIVATLIIVVVVAISFFIIRGRFFIVIFIFTPVIPIAIVFCGSSTVLTCMFSFTSAIIIESFLTFTGIQVVY